MKGIILDIEVLYYSTFRKPNSTSLILSYSIPPFTTIRGMISNALGLQRDNYFLQEEIKIGISVVDFGFKNREMSKILKLKENKNHAIHDYPSSPMFREYIVNPKYKIYLGGTDSIISHIYKSLVTPERPLYLGQSDDIIDVNTSDPLDVYEIESNKIYSITNELMIPNSIIEKIPYKFYKENDKYSVEYKIVSIPKNPPIIFPHEKKVYRFVDKHVQMF